MKKRLATLMIGMLGLSSLGVMASEAAGAAQTAPTTAPAKVCPRGTQRAGTACVKHRKHRATKRAHKHVRRGAHSRNHARRR